MCTASKSDLWQGDICAYNEVGAEDTEGWWEVVGRYIFIGRYGSEEDNCTVVERF